MGRPRKHYVRKGQRFSRLTVVDPERRLPPTKSMPSGTPAALVRCDCGTRLTVAVKSLHSGNTSSCGCLQRERSGRPEELSVRKGQRFGRLKVIDPERRTPPTPSQPLGLRAALIRCTCGTELTVWLRDLHSGHTRSCGCLQREVRSRLSRTHRQRRHLARIGKLWTQARREAAQGRMREIALQFWSVPRVGQLHEPLDPKYAPDYEDWCLVHQKARIDHISHVKGEDNKRDCRYPGESS